MNYNDALDTLIELREKGEPEAFAEMLKVLFDYGQSGGMNKASLVSFVKETDLARPRVARYCTSTWMRGGDRGYDQSAEFYDASMMRSRAWGLIDMLCVDEESGAPSGTFLDALTIWLDKRALIYSSNPEFSIRFARHMSFKQQLIIPLNMRLHTVLAEVISYFGGMGIRPNTRLGIFIPTGHVRKGSAYSKELEKSVATIARHFTGYMVDLWFENHKDAVLWMKRGVEGSEGVSYVVNEDVSLKYTFGSLLKRKGPFGLWDLGKYEIRHQPIERLFNKARFIADVFTPLQ